jgi:hypothetical protein
LVMDEAPNDVSATAVPSVSAAEEVPLKIERFSSSLGQVPSAVPLGVVDEAQHDAPVSDPASKSVLDAEAVATEQDTKRIQAQGSTPGRGVEYEAPPPLSPPLAGSKEDHGPGAKAEDDVTVARRPGGN